MAENINLSSLLGVSDGKTTVQQEAPKQESRQISVDYLTKLNDLFGAKAALGIVMQHSADDIVQMESQYDKFRFDSQPKTPKGKLERVLKFLEWEKDFPDVTEMSYYMENITESFSGFEILVEKMIATGDGGVMNFNPFVRDQLNGVARKLLSSYGVKPTAENKKTGHLAREVCNSPQKVVPGITTDELVDFCIEKKVAGTPANEYAIIEGFDDARTALEVSVMTESTLDALLCVRNGFTSLSQVRVVSFDKLKALEEAFDFKGGWNSRAYHDKNFKRFVSSYIRGKPERVDEMLSLAQAGGEDYLVAFDGSVGQTQRILKVAEDERPSARAVQYARDVLKVYEFKDAVALAREIDSPHKEVFDHEFATKEEFLAFMDDYQATLDDFVKKTGVKPDEDGNVSGFSYDGVKAFQGDLRFVSDGFSIYSAADIAKVESVMDFDTYQGLNVNSKSLLIPILIDEGYTLEQMQEAFGGEIEVDEFDLRVGIRELKDTMSLTEELKDTMSLTEVLEVIASGVKADYAVEMLRTVPFREHGIPCGVLSSLESHEISPRQFRAFIDTVGVSRYQPTEEDLQTPRATTPSFDALGMIKDFKVFYNQKEE